MVELGQEVPLSVLVELEEWRARASAPSFTSVVSNVFVGVAFSLVAIRSKSLCCKPVRTLILLQVTVDDVTRCCPKNLTVVRKVLVGLEDHDSQQFPQAFTVVSLRMLRVVLTAPLIRENALLRKHIKSCNLSRTCVQLSYAYVGHVEDAAYGSPPAVSMSLPGTRRHDVYVSAKRLRGLRHLRVRYEIQ